MITGTVKELSVRMACDYQQALAVLNFLADKGVVKRVGSRRSETGKGKPAALFEVPQGVLSVQLVKLPELPAIPSLSNVELAA